MDIQAKGWHMQMVVSGKADPIIGEGSIQDCLRTALTQLKMLNPRTLKDGKFITLRFGDQVFEGKGATEAEEINEALSKIDMSQAIDGPCVGEDYAAFYQRNLDEGLAPEAAAYMANDWFDQPQDSETVLWNLDPKVQRFLQLHSIPAELAKAHPEEYGLLRKHIESSYPKRASGIAFKL